ncbi:MAG TPA: aldo/keto reductase [Longimicrobiales bacterium]|nr:aldo/keto reductase [Longimicrobiales bacterium]
MERIHLAPGLEISRVLTGLWQVADMEREGEPLDADGASRAMDAYVDRGLTTFDMADHYGSSELIAGAFQTRRPGEAQLLTKWVPEPGPVTEEAVRDAVDRALRRMSVDALDLLQFHAWSYTHPGWLDAVFTLDALRREGRIRHLGLTNVDTAHLRMLLASGVPIVSNQVCFSLLDRRARGRMSALCLDRGVKLLAFGTLAGGFLTERWLGRPEPHADELETWSEMKYARFIEAAGGWSVFQDVLEAVHTVAERRGVSMANVASRAILEEPAVAGVIIGARLGRSQHIDDNLALASFRLDEADRALLGEATEALHPIPGDCGDEYRTAPFLTASGDLSHHLESFPPPYPVREGPGARRRALSGTVWEDLAGFSRAVRSGDRILVSGTTATHGDRLIGGGDAYAQAVFCLDKMQGAVESLGGTLADVVRTRIYIRRPEVWEEVSRAHGERFGALQPANTLVQAGLVGDGYLVEIEAEAVAGSGGAG